MFFVLIFLIAAASPVRCFAGIPIVKIHYDIGKIEYRHQDEMIKCGEGEAYAGGCTHTNYKQSQIHVEKGEDGKTVIDMHIGFKRFLIDISTKFQPDTCEFDQIVKHELTHVALHRKTLEKYKTAMAAEMLAVIGDDTGLSISEIANRAKGAFEKVFENYRKEDERQQGLLDGPDHYAYQWEHNCVEKKTCGGIERDKRTSGKMAKIGKKNTKERTEKDKEIRENVEKGRKERSEKRLLILQKLMKNEVAEGETSFKDEYGYMHTMSLSKKNGYARCLEAIYAQGNNFLENSIMRYSAPGSADAISQKPGTSVSAGTVKAGTGKVDTSEIDDDPAAVKVEEPSASPVKAAPIPVFFNTAPRF